MVFQLFGLLQYKWANQDHMLCEGPPGTDFPFFSSFLLSLPYLNTGDPIITTDKTG